jgi:hypothetical protein
VYTPNAWTKKAATHEKTTGYGFNPLEKISFYNKVTLNNSAASRLSRPLRP